MKTFAARRGEKGFTLVELAIAVVIIGVLAAFGVPRYLASVERARAAEAFTYLSTVSSAQERYAARMSTYSKDTKSLDIQMDAPEFFKVGKVAVPKGSKSLETGWEMTLTRSGKAAGYGAYTVTYNNTGYDTKKSTIPDEINPRAK
ncbi:MAG: hypothetical protein DHS20C15_11520 [Planctomycetota bacterium]|nr:MAG: hypothetical protein DHS20C15_11520 [Planctomycetota bacterium]